MMRFIRWFTRNWADTDEPGDPTLIPFDIPISPTDARARIEAAVRGLPRWRIENAAAGTMHITRRTRLWRFVDDITLRLEPTAQGTRIHARSQSRLGSADLGQNRRNLLELFAALKS
jgi:uncharacterized protein (DUF1499 family)